MIDIRSKKDLARLRRRALATQGLLQTSPFGRGLSGTKKTIEHLGYIQIDTISVVERAHHHVLYSRVPTFRPAMINKLMLSGDLFEYWSHAAAFLPMADYRYSLPYKHAIKSGQTHWHKNPDRKLMRQVLKRIQSDGPLRSRDIEDSAAKRTGWWDWKPAKKALEQLYMEGDLMVSHRDGFQKTYDLTERVLPDHVNTAMPDIDQFAAHMVQQQFRCHAMVSLKGITYLRRNPELRRAVKAQITDGLARHQLEEIRIAGGEIFIAQAGALEQPLPRASSRISILSPFDNSVIQRDRLKALFDYDYQIECYLPPSKRRYGYFSLPLLYRDRFIGRMDCKAHRKEGRLEIKHLHFESHGFSEDRIVSQFARAVAHFMRFQNCDSVSLRKVSPARLRSSLRRALADYDAK